MALSDRASTTAEPAGAALTARLTVSLSALVRERGELLAIALLVVVMLVLPGNRVAGIYGLGLAAGGVLALHAVGLVLVHRANGIINIAQVQMGLVGGVLFAQLTVRRQFLVWTHEVCNPCVQAAPAGFTPGLGVDPEDLSDSQLAALAADGWLVTANYVLSILFSLVVVTAVVYGVYHLVVKRFAEAPRLVLTLVTIGLAEAFLLVADLVPAMFGEGGIRRATPPPVDLRFSVGATVFDTVDVLKLAVPLAAIGALIVFFRRSSVGTALRASADNPSRAETLGVPVSRLNARVWVIAGLLSAAAAMLQASAVGIEAGAAWSTLVRALAAAVLAGFVSLPLALVGAAVVGMFDQSILRAFGSSLLTEGVLVVVVLGVLLLVRSRAGRADTESSSWSSSREVRPIPAELRHVPVVVSWRRRSGALLATTVLALPWLLSPSQTSQAAIAVIYGIVALSLLVLTGWAGQISLGQVGFAAVGAWVAAVLDWPFPFGFLAGGAAGASVAVLLGVPALRLRGMHLAVVTLAFAVAVPAVLLNPRYLARSLPDSLDRPILLGLDLADQRTFYYVTLLFLAAAVAAVVGMRRSRTARALIACRDNEPAAQSFGIDLLRARLTAFGISGFMAATAGILLSWANFGVQAAAYGPGVSVKLFLVAVLGGLGSVAGPLIGAAWFGTTLVSSSDFVGYVASLGLGVGTIVILLFMPGGIGQAVYQIRDSLLRRVADRHHIAVPSLSADRRADDVSDRAPIQPKQRPGGGQVFVPDRYRLDGNWIVRGAARIDAAERDRDRAGVLDG